MARKVQNWEDCSHTEIYEGEYYNGSWSTMPPFRICSGCGAHEEGWGSGYHVLTDEPDRIIKNVSRDEALSKRPRVRKVVQEPVRIDVSWCYGNKQFAGHPVLVEELKHGSGTRCSAEHDLPVRR